MRRLQQLRREYVARRLAGTDDLDFDALLEAYVEHYGGEPPLMAM